MTLDSYEKLPPPNYWLKWPFTDLPTSSEENTSINVEQLQLLINNTKLCSEERQFAQKVANTAKFGADIMVDPKNMPAMDVAGMGLYAEKAVGEQLADVVASMVLARHVAGPFHKSPLFNIRLNKVDYPNIFRLNKLTKCKDCEELYYLLPLGYY